MSDFSISSLPPLTSLVNAHFLLGGLVFGLLGALLVKVCSGAKGWQWLWLVVAKYVSTTLLLFPVCIVFENRLPRWLGLDPLARLPLLVAALGALVFVLSVLVEWPFFHLVSRPKKARISLALAMRANAAALIVLVAYYLPFCELSLMTMPRASAAPIGSDGHGCQVFYLREGGLYRRDRGSSGESLITRVHFGGEARLFARRGDQGWDLWLQDADSNPQRLWVKVAPNLAEIPQQAALHVQLKQAVRTGEATLSETYGKPAGTAPEGDSPWSLRLGRWPSEGLEISSRDLKGAYRVALNTPLLSWNARCATRLSSEQVLFQMGPYLWLLDLETRQIRVFAKGQGALVMSSEA